MKKQLLLLLTFCIVLSACATFPKDDIKVTADADPEVNFTDYKTYGWLGSAGVLIDPEGKWKPVGFDIDSEITFLINRELRKRNIQESDNNPDMVVMYVIGVDMAVMQEKLNPNTNIKSLQNVPQGGLVLGLIDTRTGYVIWAANATAEIKNLPSEQAKKRLDYVVTRMIDKLPK